jgi:hypothetical protein
MTYPPGFTFAFHDLPEAEMIRLWVEHDMDQKLSQCAPPLDTTVDQGVMHHTFCCTIKISEFFEPGTSLPLAILHQQIPVNGRAQQRFIRAFRLEANVYVNQGPSPITDDGSQPASVATSLLAPQGVKS